VLPLYVAVMLCIPEVSVEVVNFAAPPLRATVFRTVALGLLQWGLGDVMTQAARVEDGPRGSDDKDYRSLIMSTTPSDRRGPSERTDAMGRLLISEHLENTIEIQGITI
jgi:hypothetical protein